MKKIISVIISLCFLLNIIYIIPNNVYAITKIQNDVKSFKYINTLDKNEVLNNTKIVALEDKGMKVTKTDGDWRAKYYYGASDRYKNLISQNLPKVQSNVSSTITPEADYVVRVGDIDDFGLGWRYNPNYFFNELRTGKDKWGNDVSETWTYLDPFSGESTSGHYWGSGWDENDNFQWDQINTNEPSGLDKIITVSSFNGYAPSEDGYSTRKLRGYNEYGQYTTIDAPRITPKNSEGVINIKHNIKQIISKENGVGFNVSAAVIQMFVDDFQPAAGGASEGRATYEVRFIDDKGKTTRVTELEDLINHLNQTGPVGKLITFQIPVKYHEILKNNNNLKISIDDPNTGAGDGYAIDFVKLMVNPRELMHEGTIEGYVRDAYNTSKGIAKAYVEINGKWKTYTDDKGHYKIEGVTSGQASVKAYKAGEYKEQIKNVDVIDNKISTLNFYLEPIEKVEESIKVDKTVKEVTEGNEQEFLVTMTVTKIKDSERIKEMSFTIEDEIADEFLIVGDVKAERSNNLSKPIISVKGNDIICKFNKLQNNNEVFKLIYKIKKANKDIKPGVYPTSRKPATLTGNDYDENKIFEMEFPQVEVLLKAEPNNVIKIINHGLYKGKNSIDTRNPVTISNKIATSFAVEFEVKEKYNFDLCVDIDSTMEIKDKDIFLLDCNGNVLSKNCYTVNTSSRKISIYSKEILKLGKYTLVYKVYPNIPNMKKEDIIKVQSKAYYNIKSEKRNNDTEKIIEINIIKRPNLI